MIMKLLLTLAVMGIAWWILRNRYRQDRLSTNQQRLNLATPGAQSSVRIARLLAYGLVVLMMLASGLFLYLQWRDDYRIVNVRVINLQTGRAVTYAARRGEVGERHFQTLDGRIVQVADIERIEIGGNGVAEQDAAESSARQ